MSLSPVDKLLFVPAPFLSAPITALYKMEMLTEWLLTERLSNKLLDPVVLLLTILLEMYQEFDKTTIFFFRFLLKTECQIRLFKNNVIWFCV